MNFIIFQILQKALDKLNCVSLELNSKSNVRKFSVVGEKTTEIVTIFSVEKTLKKVASCQSSVCTIIGKSNKREIKHLGREDLCDHLKKLHEYMLKSGEYQNQENDISMDIIPREKVKL